MNNLGIEWTLGPIVLAYALGIVYEPVIDIAIYIEDLDRVDIKQLEKWNIRRIFLCKNPGFSNRSIYVLGLPCISPKDILESYSLNRNYPIIKNLILRSRYNTLNP